MISIQGELQHKIIKRRFARTNRRNHTFQLAAAEVRERVMQRISQRITDRARMTAIKGRHQKRRRMPSHDEIDETDMSETTTMTMRYNIGNVTKERENLLQWVYANRSDVATKVWHSKYIYTCQPLARHSRTLLINLETIS
jgi:hypothetical protein